MRYRTKFMLLFLRNSAIILAIFISYGCQKNLPLTKKEKYYGNKFLQVAEEGFENSNYIKAIIYWQKYLQIDPYNKSIKKNIHIAENYLQNKERHANTKKIDLEKINKLKTRSSNYDKKDFTIAVVDFEPRNVSAADASFISEFFREELVMSGQVTVVERTQMENILEEQGFQQSGCTTQDCAIQVGKILNVNYIFIGSFGQLLQSYQITIRLVNVENGEIIYADNESCKLPRNLNTATSTLANRFVKQLKNTFQKLYPPKR